MINMIPEIGHILLIMSTVFALLSAASHLIGSYQRNLYLIAFGNRLFYALFFTLLTALCSLVFSFIADDFSVAYVANHSNSQLALGYKVAAVWGSHEGSMLFWVFAIALWGAVINWRQATHSAKLDLENLQADKAYFGRVLAILALVILGFNLFLLFTSNPFARLLPNIPVEGRDLNPILQDIGLILHPPMLFLGYVGLTVCFAAALASLIGGKLPARHLDYLRPWVLLAWIFLTGGNAFGSWWAYNELGWGGWWFWDPVENASFIPWLVATALVHSLVLTRKTQGFTLTTLFLCLLAFSLSLLGSFLVRSGIVQSVHAFAADPTRGMSILSLLVIFVGAALLIFALKANLLRREIDFGLYSKETLLLLGIVILVVAAFSVLLGTFYPLIYELLNLGTLSVGAPYFNAIFVPLTFLVVLLMGIAPLVEWQNTSKAQAMPILLFGFGVLAIAFWVSLQAASGSNLFLLLGTAAALWLIVCLLLTLLVSLSVRKRASTNQITANAPVKSRTSKQRFIGMMLAHLGVAITIIGASAVSNFEEEALLRMGPGQGKPLAGYILVYESTENVETNSFTAIQANISIRDGANDEEILGYVRPQRQTFKSNAMEMSHAGIDHGFWRDIYVSMGVQLSDSEYLIRISYKPLATWIWLGALFMMLGGAIAAWPVRQARRVEQSEQLSTSSSSARETVTQ
ncbi:heme lyase NrfEFG subunit NrfE [Shewanella oneidensis MR-1]|uniref:Cytochrome c maturation system haem lyase subunit SirE n=1 Tax=Shewanella oneidensis (strain ATCC 700550 / JCM 31522 / CIP 106686 / LMG 19005 / NCIMB 14063 / MR-1) TaxID=211586 RepID=Q8EJI7_SHEON|nr:heme lyase NrfEFG subunit NrfE [Shewanella oneidensis]AAN53559.2 cytochrome c maturation system haem lyase subunit SirE [Shewanella oneidensis MR-1]MDX5997579.1 heme lyase NrfEFG subunit NrfE [Shewanella oneidensis]MEE2028853.1 Cytochrome c-type biogenesis protein CcmF [Shewanella oneidensis]QKG95395.1 heme lyase NrfEFG subunit NrfE [Shewanella oneidensis MR-1]